MSHPVAAVMYSRFSCGLLGFWLLFVARDLVDIMITETASVEKLHPVFIFIRFLRKIFEAGASIFVIGCAFRIVTFVSWRLICKIGKYPHLPPLFSSFSFSHGSLSLFFSIPDPATWKILGLSPGRVPLPESLHILTRSGCSRFVRAFQTVALDERLNRYFLGPWGVNPRVGSHRLRS